MCVCARVYELRIVSTDKVARFLNTCVIIVVLLIIYPFIVLEMHGLKTFANSVNKTGHVVGEKLSIFTPVLCFSSQISPARTKRSLDVSS